jgi:hypothetical protein
MVICQQDSYLPQLIRLSDAQCDEVLFALVRGQCKGHLLLARGRSEHVLSLVAGWVAG